MTEFPALRDALVGAATKRRRRRRVAGAALPLVAACAVAVTLVSLPGPGKEREGVAPETQSPLEQRYGVFRRPQRPQDVMPARPRDHYAMDAARTRLVAHDGSTRVFAGPTRDGRSLCTITVSGGGYLGGCGPISALRDDVAQGGWMGSTEALLFEDGVRDVRLLLQNGRREAPRVVDNGLLARSPIGYTGVSWTSASGTRYVNRIKPPARGAGPPSTCPSALAPLPPDAMKQARRVALLAVDQLYPGAASARVTEVQTEPGTPCAQALTIRMLEVTLKLVPADPRQRKSASLSQGRLLVGMQDGALRVVYLLH
jgi:hypothetical protein